MLKPSGFHGLAKPLPELQEKNLIIEYERLYIGAGQPDLFFIYDRSSPGSAVSAMSWAQVKSSLGGGR